MGADCSWMRESVGLAFPGVGQTIATHLKGIGPVPIVSLERLAAVFGISRGADSWYGLGEGSLAKLRDYL